MVTTTALDSHLEAIDGVRDRLPGRDRPRLEALRDEARRTFSKRGFPTTRDEDWKYTNVSAIAKTDFRPGPETAVEEAALPSLGLVAGHRLVLVNGRLVDDLSVVGKLPAGVVLAGLGRALAEHPERVEEHLGGLVAGRDLPFASWNTASFRDGVLLWVSEGVRLDTPVHIQHLAVPGADPVGAHPRLLVVLEAGASAVVVESHAGTGEGSYLTNVVSEMHVGDGARLEHVKVETERPGSFHVAGQVVTVGRNGHAATRHVALGSGLARTDLHAVLMGEGAECVMDGLYLGDGDRHVDYHTTIDHAVPHGESRELFKGILDGKSTGVFHGRIIVRPDAQKTDAKQTNRNLLLSEGARVVTRPQLEIYADDVKCTHGATTGRLDEEALFYLRSRGIAAPDARSLLTVAFAAELLEGIPLPELRTRLREMLVERLPGPGVGKR